MFVVFPVVFVYFSLISSIFFAPSFVNSIFKYTIVPDELAVFEFEFDPYITFDFLISSLFINTSFVSLSTISNFPLVPKLLTILSVESFSGIVIVIFPLCLSSLIS